MSDSHRNHSNDEDTSAWQPGAKLKSLREEAGISLDTIAKETRIPQGKLKALEEDAYTQVGTEVFVTAYIRKYAGFLGIASDPFVDQYKLLSGSQSTREHYMEAPAGSESRSASSSVLDNFRAWHVVVVVVVVWLLSVFLLDSDEHLDTEPLPNLAEQTVDLPGQRHELPAGAEDAQAAGTALPEEEALDEQPLEEIRVEDEDLSSPALSVNAESSRSEAAGADILVMSFVDECWVKVWDANGEVIFAHLQNSGDNLRLSGEAPFSVMLGNARAADLLVNGRRISIEPPAGRRTLRLNVGP